MTLRHALLLALPLLTACGEKTPVQLATKAADQACACSDYDCAKGVAAELNKYAVKNDAMIQALPAAEKDAYMAQVKRLDGCRDAMKP